MTFEEIYQALRPRKICAYRGAEQKTTSSSLTRLSKMGGS